MPLIFQYGSNCDASRLSSDARLGGDAEDLGRAETLGEYDIGFHVWSRSNGCAAADLITTPGCRAWGVLYKVSDKGYEKLKQTEGSRYEPTAIRVRKHTGEVVEAITFLVRRDERRAGLWTSFEYVRHIVNGLREHGVPEDWVAHVLEVAIKTNAHATADATRAAEEIRVLRTL
jgi:cation transport regulator ChaC